MQICSIAEELLKTEYDALRIVYNQFGSAVSYKPTIATILSPDVRQFCSDSKHKRIYTLLHVMLHTNTVYDVYAGFH